MKNFLPIDWSKIYKENKGRWVALDNDEVTVIASGVTPKAALEEAQTKGKKNPILMFMPEDLKAFAG